MSEINLEFLLGVMPPAEATLYRVLIQLIPAPGAESTIAASRQIELAELAKLTGFSKRWVIELLQRLEEKNFIRTDGGSGMVKWIRLLPLGAPRLGKSYPTELMQKEKTSPVQVPRVAASQPKRRRRETAQSPKVDADINAAPPVEKPAAIPARRPKGPMPSIPPADPAADNPVVLATTVIPPPPAPAGPVLPAAMVPPPPPSAGQGGPAAGNPRGARRQDRTAAFHGTKRPGSRQSGSARRHGDASAFSGPRRPGSRQPLGARRHGDATASDTSKTDPSPAAKAGRPARRSRGIRMLPSRHFRLDLVAQGGGRERTPVAYCSRNPLPGEAPLRAGIESQKRHPLGAE